MTTNTHDPRPSSGTERLHGLDALRGGALLLGIVLHALLPFIPGLPWLINDSQTTWLAGAPVYLIHLFRMSLFMLLAGYFGRLVLHRRGAGGYLKDRALRILLPLIVFWPVSVLSLGLLVGVNAQVNDLPVPSPPAGDSSLWAVFTPGQLWFLAVLMQCALIVVLSRAVLLRVCGERRLARWGERLGGVLSGPAGVLWVSLPYLVGLLLQGTVVGGILAPATVLPEPPALTAYLGAFVVGWLLQGRPDALTRIARGWPVLLGVAVLLTAVGLPYSQPGSPLPLLPAAALNALAGWSWTYALLGLCVRFLRTERPWIRYLADASYWMYLLHLPILIAVEIPLVNLGWPIPVKLILTLAVTTLVLLLSYHLLVRSTPLGGWLNGRRHPFRLPGVHNSPRLGQPA